MYINWRSPSVDPIQFQRLLWPHVRFYDKQIEVIYSCEDNDETVVPAGNMLGKDFVAGFIALKNFICHERARVVTTSVKDKHLDVLWGEINRFIATATLNGKTNVLLAENGGPLLVNHRMIRKVVRKELCPISYLVGMVSEKGEGMAGHHAPFTLFVGDEASGLDDVTYTQADTWAKKKLIFGNCNPCANFFYRMVEEGDLPYGMKSKAAERIEDVA